MGAEAVNGMAPPRPQRSTIDVDAIPSPLRARDQWVTFCFGFRDGSWTKIPKQPNGRNAKSNDPTTWSPFQAALDAFEADPTLDGISYIFAEDDPYCCVDIDKVRSTPERLAWALGIVERFGTYAEWSVSGNGLHIVGKGRMPDADGTPQKGRSDQKKGLEAYSRRRQLTFTGKVVEGTPTTLVDVQEHLDWLLANEFKPKTSKPTVSTARAAGPIATTDRIEKIKERMINGPRGDQLRRLYAGNASDYLKPDGSPDWSAADLSFCSGAWYYADGDEATVEQIWLSSGLALARPNGHKLDRADYRQSTISTAAGSKTFRDTHGYSAWEDPPRIQFTPKPPEPKAITNTGGAPCPSDQPATLEEARALIARLRQENDELGQSNRDLLGWVDRTAGFVEELQTINAGMRAETTALKAKLAEIRDLMAIPSKRLSYPAKCLAVVLDNVFEATATYRADPDKSQFVQVRYADLAAKLGGSDSTVAREMNKTLCTDVQHPAINAAAPILKHTQFVERMIDGELRPTSETTIALKADTSMLSAVLTYQPDEERKHGGARTPGCPKPECAGADLIIRSTTHCAKCGDQIGPRRETLRHQVDVLENPPTAPVDDGYSGQQVDVLEGHDGEEQTELAANVIPIGTRPARLRRQDAGLGRPRTVTYGPEVSEEAERRDLDLMGTCSECHQYVVKRRRSGIWTCSGCLAVLKVEPWAQAPPRPSREPWRCRCGSLERYAVPDGYRCDGCGQVVMSAPAEPAQDGAAS